MAEAEKAYLFRPYVQDDLNFIKNSWGSSYYKGCNYQHLLSPKEFHSYHRPIRDQILSRANATAIVCAAKELDTIIGWILVETIPTNPKLLILHYLYVKEAFKNEKIAKELLKMSLGDLPVLFTHLTHKAQKILFKKQLNHFHYVPHLI